MMLRINSLLVLLAATAASIGVPDEARSQPRKGAEGAPEADASASERLEARARKLAERGRAGWARAATLYTRAAELRGPLDWGAPEDLILAGHLYFYAAQHEASVLAFRTAGQMFVAMGQLQRAAASFRDGAWVASQAGMGARAQELRAWVEVLTRPQPQTGPGQRRLTTDLARRS
jgi:hypothetical protein